MILHQVDGGSDGNGYGYGSGYGNGDGYGNGYGDGNGNGDGYGYGNSSGYGYGYGNSNSDGDLVAPCVSQMYLLSAMVNGDTLIPNVQELTKENDDEEPQQAAKPAETGT